MCPPPRLAAAVCALLATGTANAAEVSSSASIGPYFTDKGAGLRAEVETRRGAFNPSVSFAYMGTRRGSAGPFVDTDRPGYPGATISETFSANASQFRVLAHLALAGEFALGAERTLRLSLGGGAGVAWALGEAHVDREVTSGYATGFRQEDFGAGAAAFVAAGTVKASVVLHRSLVLGLVFDVATAPRGSEERLPEALNREVLDGASVGLGATVGGTWGGL